MMTKGVDIKFSCKVQKVSPAAIQRAKCANAFDTLNEHYHFNINEYQREKFEIGCEFATQLHPLVASKSKRFWEFWSYLWDMNLVFLATYLEDFGHHDFYKTMRVALDSEQNYNNMINYINRVDESSTK